MWLPWVLVYLQTPGYTFVTFWGGGGGVYVCRGGGASRAATNLERMP